MKKMLMVAAAMLVLCAPVALSLEIYLGPQAGPNFGFRWGDGYEFSHTVSDPKVNAAIRGSFGGFAEVVFWQVFSVQAEGYYTIESSRAKGMISGTDTFESFDQKYVETLILAKLRLGRKRTRFVAFAGPDLKYGVGEWHYKVTPHPVLGPPDELIEYYDLDDRETLGINNWVYGVVFGIGVEIDLGPGYLSQGLRSYLGFTDYDDSGLMFRPGNVMYTIGYGFKVK